MKTRTLFVSLLWLLVPMASAGQTAATGYAVTNFATGFPNNGSVGPAGLAFDASGNLFVGDFITGVLYKFSPAGGTASAATQVNATPFFLGSRAHGLAVGKDRNLYVSLYDLGEVGQLDPVTGQVVRILASGIFHPRALATDPLSGDLFVSEEGSTIFRISNFASGPGTLTTYVNTPFTDGIAFGPDGTLYGADQALQGVVKISGTNSPPPTPSTWTFIASVPFVDGIAVSASPGTPFLYGNRNDGTVTKIDLTTTPPMLTNIVTAGSRGDFAAVGPDGCLYATQTDRVLKVTNADGTCLPPPLGPLFPTNPGPSAFVFSAFCAEFETSEDEPKEFELHSRFMLAANSDGINPVAEAVTLQLGTLSTTIPAGSFTKTKSGRFVFEGGLSGVALEVRIASLGNNSFTLKARGKGVDLSAMPKPVTVGLTIGNDTGSTAAFSEEEEEEGTRDH